MAAPLRRAPTAAHRIFRVEWLHRLQVRYPWFCGYAVAPLAFHLGRHYGLDHFTYLSRMAPLLASQPWDAHYPTMVAVLFCGHFIRRAAEVVFVNDYTGTWVRDSRLELLYYFTWGLLAGSSVGDAPLRLHGVPTVAVRGLGAALFLVGQLGNAWCHLELRRLRAERHALGSQTYIIPDRGPFSYIASPHYSFELLTWTGYALHNGVDPVGGLLLFMSVIAMGAFARDRHAKYVELFEQGERAHGDPRRRWKMIPLVW